MLHLIREVWSNIPTVREKKLKTKPQTQRKNKKNMSAKFIQNLNQTGAKTFAQKLALAERNPAFQVRQREMAKKDMPNILRQNMFRQFVEYYSAR